MIKLFIFKLFAGRVAHVSSQQVWCKIARPLCLWQGEEELNYVQIFSLRLDIGGKEKKLEKSRKWEILWMLNAN